jgi:uncharacterized HAD superfamily protein
VKIGIDIDGVMCDFANPANEWMAKWLGQDLAKIDRWNWYTNFGARGPAAWKRLWDMIHANGWMANLPSIEGAVRTIRELDADGVWPVFITNRNPDLKEQTHTWMVRHGLAHLEVVHTDDKTSVPCDIYLDDKLDNIHAYGREGLKSYLFLTEYNWRAWYEDDHMMARTVSSWAQFDLIVRREMP